MFDKFKAVLQELRARVKEEKRRLTANKPSIRRVRRAAFFTLPSGLKCSRHDLRCEKLKGMDFGKIKVRRAA